MVKFLQIEPTTRCNFSCSFCVGKYLFQKDLSYNDFKYILLRFPNIKYLHLQGEGEPLLNPYFFDMLRYVKKLNPSIITSTITNGSLLDINYDKIMENNLDYVFVSIEHADKQKFKKIRGGDLNKIKQGIRKVMDSQSSTKIGFAILLLKNSLNDLGNIVSLYTQLNMNGGLYFNTLFTSHYYTKYYSESVKKEILDENDSKRFIYLVNNIPTFKSIIKRDNVYNFCNIMSQNTNVCGWLTNALFITANMYVSPCTFAKEDKYQSFGKLKELSNSDILDKKSDMIKSLQNGILPISCLGCPFGLSTIERINNG